MDRLGGGETALRTLRVGRTPVFAVPPSYTRLPQRALVALDFSTASLAAAQQSLMLFPSLTTLTGVHVTPRWDVEPLAYSQWRMEYERGVGPAFERALRDLDAPIGVTVRTAIREGPTTKELLKAAEEAEAEVIIVGSRGLGFFDRVLVGSTATGIIRGAHCAVFALPILAAGVHEETPAAAEGSGAGVLTGR
jgi:nucleotide-binding universal stress UspA family protein